MIKVLLLDPLQHVRWSVLSVCCGWVGGWVGGCAISNNPAINRYNGITHEAVGTLRALNPIPHEPFYNPHISLYSYISPITPKTVGQEFMLGQMVKAQALTLVPNRKGRPEHGSPQTLRPKWMLLGIYNGI